MDKKNYFYSSIDRNITFPYISGQTKPNPLPTVPVNCYGKNSCIQAVAYADMISIRVDATQTIY